MEKWKKWGASPQGDGGLKTSRFRKREKNKIYINSYLLYMKFYNGVVHTFINILSIEDLG